MDYASSTASAQDRVEQPRLPGGIESSYAEIADQVGRAEAMGDLIEKTLSRLLRGSEPKPEPGSLLNAVPPNRCDFADRLAMRASELRRALDRIDAVMQRVDV